MEQRSVLCSVEVDGLSLVIREAETVDLESFSA